MRFRHSASIVAAGAMAAAVLAASARGGPGRPHRPGAIRICMGLWNMTHGTPLERPEGVTAGRPQRGGSAPPGVAARSNAFFTPRDGDPGFYNEFWFEWGKEDNRTAMIDDPPDGRIPMNPGVREREDAVRSRAAGEGPSRPTPGSTCRSTTAASRAGRCPRWPTNYNNNWNILQAPGYVVIFQEMIHDARIIPLDGRPHIDARHPAVARRLARLAGRATRWSSRPPTSTAGTTSTARGRTCTWSSASGASDADNLDWQWTITDASVYSQPWTGSLPLTSTEGPLFEYACHEGNYGLYNILAGARAEEARATAK